MKLHRRHFDSSRGGFTLIELLVVVGVVALLAAFLLPGLMGMLDSTKRTKSMNNLRAMGGGLMAYVADHNGKLIEGAINPTYGGKRVRFWYNALDAYMGGLDYTPEGQKMGVRPAWQNCPGKVFPEPVYDATSSGAGVGYGWNHSNFGYTPAWHPEKMGWASRLSDVEEPASTIIIGTSIDGVEAPALQNVLIYSNTSQAARRFNGRGLYLLLDGHVAAFTPEEITAEDSFLFKKHKH